MRNMQLEKKIIKIDRDIEALNIAKKYLSNPAEIEEVKVGLNRERQLLIFGLYQEDNQSASECRDLFSHLVGVTLLKEQQLDILEKIKEIYGRRFPDVSKNSNGLNAWLNFIGIECNWILDDDTEWAKLVITKI